MPNAAEWFAPTKSNVAHTNGCVINSQVGGDHAYCECECHEGTLPAIPPSRERRSADEPFPPAKTVIEEIAAERNALRDEVAELKRKVSDVTSQRDALRVQNAELFASLQSVVDRGLIPLSPVRLIENDNSPAK